MWRRRARLHTVRAGAALSDPAVRALSAASATSAITPVWITAQIANTGVTPSRSRSGPAPRIPIGIARANTVMKLEITVARSSGGMRSVMIACRLGLMSPFASPEAPRTPIAAHAGTSKTSSQSGSAWPRATRAIRVKPSMRFTSR